VEVLHPVSGIFDRRYGLYRYPSSIDLSTSLGELNKSLFLSFLSFPGDWLVSSLWLPWSILVDYVSLLKTRIILYILTVLKTNLVAIVVVGLDYMLYRLLFTLSVLILWPVSICIYNYAHFVDICRPSLLSLLLPGELFSIMIDGVFRFPEVGATVFTIFFWAGLVPSIWMWLYVLALFVTRALLRSEKLLNWLRWALDIEKNPFRSIGAVAAALAFIASVAIILVSAEVSRISTAS
jgi:hypothetical protein